MYRPHTTGHGNGTRIRTSVVLSCMGLSTSKASSMAPRAWIWGGDLRYPVLHLVSSWPRLSLPVLIAFPNPCHS